MKINKESIKKILLTVGKILIILGGGVAGGAMFALAVIGTLAGYPNVIEMFK